MRVLNRNQQRQILMLMCRSNGVGDIVEITGHSPNTVRRYLARFGEACAAIHDCDVRGLRIRRAEVDEIWSYVYAKEEARVSKDQNKRPPPPDLGAFWTWVAIDPTPSC